MDTGHVNVTINLDGNIYTGIVEIDKAMGKMNVTTKSSLKAFDNLNKFAFKVNNILSATRTIVGGVANTMQKYTAASRAQAEVEAKLAAVMRNTMDAGQNELQSILDLTAAQQKLGIVGDEVQLAGAQELATYLSKTETLKQLLPVMNDMVAQQYGLNATQQSAVGIATMMGKVMDGQVGALSRYGYKFDEAQEKILKFGTEEQRAAVLAEVVSASVGGMNAALAATPDGAMQQVRNRMGDINERVGALFTNLRTALMPAIDQLMGFAERLMDGVMRNQDKIATGVKWVTDNMWGLVAVFGTLFAYQASKKASEMAAALLEVKANIATTITAASEKLNAMRAAFMRTALSQKVSTVATKAWAAVQGVASVAASAVSARLATMRAAIMRTAVAQKVAAVATKVWAGVQAAFNVIASLNPIGLIVMGITALVAAIAACIKWFDSWGETVLNCMGPIGWAIASVVRHWDSLKKAFTDGGILAGLKRIGVVLLDALLLPVQKLLELLSRVPGMGKLAEGGAQRIAALRERHDLIPAAAKPSIAQQASIGTNAKLEQAVNGGSRGLLADGDTGAMPAAQRSTEAVATGGQRNTSINISLKSLVESMTFEGTAAQNAEQVERDMAQTLLRVLNMAASAAI